ncbi:hypothetical protein DESC_660068 [Desulfosarcina cetonica]|nr:hypothetical protein DESC_660068 [Desulfosarcina cetonica]
MGLLVSEGQAEIAIPDFIDYRVQGIERAQVADLHRLAHGVAAAGVLIVVVAHAQSGEEVVPIDRLVPVGFVHLSAHGQLAAHQGVLGTAEVEPVFGSVVVLQAQPGVPGHGEDRPGVDHVAVPRFKLAVGIEQPHAHQLVVGILGGRRGIGVAPGAGDEQIDILVEAFLQIGAQQKGCGIPIADLGHGLQPADIPAGIGLEDILIAAFRNDEGHHGQAGEAVGDVPGMGVVEHRAGGIVVEQGCDDAEHMHVIHIRLLTAQGIGIAPVAFEAHPVAELQGSPGNAGHIFQPHVEGGAVKLPVDDRGQGRAALQAVVAIFQGRPVGGGPPPQGKVGGNGSPVLLIVEIRPLEPDGIAMGQARGVAVQGHIAQTALVDLDLGAVTEHLVGRQPAGETELVGNLGRHVEPELVGQDDVVVGIVLFRCRDLG